MSIEQMEKLLQSIKFGKQELQIHFGKFRYDTMVSEVKEVLDRNGLNEFTSFQLVDHLRDIYQAERTHVVNHLSDVTPKETASTGTESTPIDLETIYANLLTLTNEVIEVGLMTDAEHIFNLVKSIERVKWLLDQQVPII